MARPSLRDKMRSLFGKDEGQSPSSGDTPAGQKDGSSAGPTFGNMEPKRIEIGGISNSDALDGAPEGNFADFSAPPGIGDDLGGGSFGAATASWGSGAGYPDVGVVRNPQGGLATQSWQTSSDVGGVGGGGSFGSGWGGAGAGGEIRSFDSTVTDYEYLTHPNAASQQSALLAGQPPGMPPWMAGVGAGATAEPGDSEASLQAKAAELDAMAAQLMAQAYQAKAQALRMQSSQGSGAPHGGASGSAAAAGAAMGGPMGLGMPGMMGMPGMPGMGMPGMNPMMAMQMGMGPWPGQPPASANPPTHTKKERKASDVPEISESERTTVMLRNLPNDYTRAMLLELLDSNGFPKDYDFVYLPMDFKRKAGLGYGFVNMVSNQAACRAFDKLQGFSGWERLCSAKVLEVAWGHPLQGLTPHVERYRNSPVMHEDVPDEFRPLLFKDGERIAFPPPTRKLRAPRVKGGKMPDNDEDEA